MENETITPNVPAPAAPAQGAEPKSMFDRMKNIAHDFQVPISDGTINEIIGYSPSSAKKAGEQGDGMEEKIGAFTEYVKTMAQGLYPTLAPQIKSGIPTAYLLEPYRQVGKRVLGEHFEPDFIGDSRHAKALRGAVDPATGRSGPMNLSEWADHLKTDPTFGWQHTPDGIRSRNEVMQTVQQAFSKSEGK